MRQFGISILSYSSTLIITKKHTGINEQIKCRELNSDELIHIVEIL